MSFVDTLKSIKAERRLSINHWRYKILHWCFNEKNTTKPSDSSLPDYLYTHYCPLFHLTNLIVVLSPIIVLCKIVTALFKTFLRVVYYVNLKAAKYIDSKMPGPDAEEISRRFANNERKGWIKKIHENIGVDFKSLVYLRESLSRDEAQKIYDELMPKLIKAKKESEERRVKLRKQFAALINCSNVLFKFGLNILYIILGAIIIFAVVWLLWLIGYVILSIAVWLWNCNPLPFIVMALKILPVAGTIGGIIYGLYRFGLLKSTYEKCCSKTKEIFAPIKIIGDISKSFKNYVLDSVISIVDFTTMFYENNCPPITIVDAKDENDELEFEGK